jgi:hypothetical protein
MNADRDGDSNNPVPHGGASRHRDKKGVAFIYDNEISAGSFTRLVIRDLYIINNEEILFSHDQVLGAAGAGTNLRFHVPLLR